MFWGAVAAVFAHGVDLVLYGQPRQSFISNLRETVLTAAPLVVFALLLVRHAHNLHQDAMRMALTDPLTGLLNRRAFLSALAQQRSGLLFMLDLDHFKQVNDNYGHPVGDDVLCAMARMMTDNLRHCDLIGRIGGEEFAVFAPGIKQTAAQALGDLLASGVHHVEPFSRNVIHVTASVGAFWTTDVVDTTTVLRKADRALYQAKAAGRAQTVWHDPAADGSEPAPSAVA